MTPSRQIPIQHPDYRYPESRNPYWKKMDELAERIYSDNRSESLRGKWRDRAEGREIHLEIGCNAGHVVVEWAALQPKNFYLGLDWKFKQIFRGAEKAEKRKLGNLRFLRAHAERVHYIFAPGEVDHAYLFFPDPWSKKSQLKNRFFNLENLTHVAQVIRPGGTFEIKTDHFGYFEWMEQVIAQLPELWQVLERTTDLHQGNPKARELKIPQVTLFERLFIQDGIKINRIKLQRRS